MDLRQAKDRVLRRETRMVADLIREYPEDTEPKAPMVDREENLAAGPAEDTGADAARIVDDSPPEDDLGKTTIPPLVLDASVIREENSPTEPTKLTHTCQVNVSAVALASWMLDAILADVVTRMQERYIYITSEYEVQDENEDGGSGEIQLQSLSEVSLN